MKIHRWPLGITIILLLTVAANIGILYVAGRDDSFAIEPDYYAKAVAWDSTVAQRQRNQTLGWRLSPRLTGFSARDGAELSVSLTDSSGSPIEGATITVAALYNARASRVLHSTLEASGSGYSTRLAMNHRGEWEFRFDVRRGSDHFTATTRIDAEPSEGPASGNGV